MFGYNYSQQSIIRVSGEQGARNYQLMPNSSALLLDDTAPLVWLVQTDAMGIKTTCAAYKIEPYKPEPEADIKSLLARISKLEDFCFDEPDSK